MIEIHLCRKDYECREVLRAITGDEILFKTAYEPLLRTVLDYIANMTDSYASLQHTELY